ncbi:MAG: hypothetical protein QOE06_1326 [Thermoleophilaceae bacterium]|nr:hypothetical protein [Thermoleophilaceae bacterium]
MPLTAPVRPVSASQRANSFRFTGRLNAKALKPGAYRLTGTPIDIAGNTGKPVTASFKILK